MSVQDDPYLSLSAGVRASTHYKITGLALSTDLGIIFRYSVNIVTIIRY